ncbi:MAG: flagellar basal body rod protein FlgC [Angelakisella sp.]|nr:flagellar basal body rod protein FlgC [Angelakisella sp.]
MSFLNSLNITGSALTAQRLRTDIILQNLSNMNTTRTEDGEPYRRKQVVFQERELDFKNVLSNEYNKLSGGGVRVREIVESDKDFIPVYDPTHPHADENGYVMYPNVNRTEEQIDLMAATRAYEANITALNVVKAMATKALEIGE